MAEDALDTTEPQRASSHYRTPLDKAISPAGKALAWLVFIAMGISVFEVVMRYFFGNPTSWVHETVVLLIAIIFAIGGPVALAGNHHIRVRMIYDAIPAKRRRWLDLFNEFITLLFCIGLSYAAWIMTYSSVTNPGGGFQLERSGTSWNPPFPSFVKAAILVAVAVMLLQTILHIIYTLKAIIRDEPVDEPESEEETAERKQKSA